MLFHVVFNFRVQNIKQEIYACTGVQGDIDE